MPFVPVRRQINSTHGVPSYLFETHFNINLPSTLRFSKLSISLNFLYHSSIFMYLIPFELLLRIASEEYKSKAPVYAVLFNLLSLLSLLGPNIYFNTPIFCTGFGSYGSESAFKLRNQFTAICTSTLTKINHKECADIVRTYGRCSKHFSV
jgi:hypothetical protein